MCVDSLLLKFNNDEKQFTRLFISVFASDYILSPTKVGRPLNGGGWALRAGIRNNHQPFGSSYITDTVWFSHEWHTYSGCLLVCIISKWLNVMFMFRQNVVLWWFGNRLRLNEALDTIRKCLKFLINRNYFLKSGFFSEKSFHFLCGPPRGETQGACRWAPLSDTGVRYDFDWN